MEILEVDGLQLHFYLPIQPAQRLRPVLHVIAQQRFNVISITLSFQFNITKF